MRLEHGELAAALLEDAGDPEEVLGALAAGQLAPASAEGAAAPTPTAVSTSSTFARAISASGSSVAGSMVVNHWPLFGATSLPPMNRP